MIKTLFSFFPLWLIVTVLPAQSVTNIRARQEEKKIIVTYDLTGKDPGQTFNVIILVSEDGGYSWKGPLKVVSGDAGLGVKAGYAKQMVWDVLSEPGRERLQGDRIAFKVRAEYSALSGMCGNTVSHGGKKYQTIQIGNQCWFKENLNIGTRINGSEKQTNNGVIEKYCYDDNEANCSTYGGLYQWDELMKYETAQRAKGLCPDGWHIPTDAEWTTLTTSLGGESVAGGKMKEIGTTHWLPRNTGAINNSGFTALPGGYRHDDDNFNNLTIYASFWSSTEYSSSYSWNRSILYNSQEVYRGSDGKNNKMYGFSCRCLQN